MDTKEVHDLKEDIKVLHAALNSTLSILVQQRALDDFDTDEYLDIVDGLQALARHRDLPTRIVLIDRMIETGEFKK